MAVPFDSLENGKLYLMTSGNEGYLVRVANKEKDQIGIIYRGIASGRAVVQRLDDGTLEVGTIDETGKKIWVPVQFEEVSQSGGRRRKTVRHKRFGRKRHSRRHI